MLYVSRNKGLILFIYGHVTGKENDWETGEVEWGGGMRLETSVSVAVAVHDWNALGCASHRQYGAELIPAFYITGCPRITQRSSLAGLNSKHIHYICFIVWVF